MSFQPEEALLSGRARAECRACVVLPARNEEASLKSTLDSLAVQQDGSGRRLAAKSFEILLLLNNCTDGSAAVAHAWQRAHPEIELLISEIELPEATAHIGTVRRRLMDTAWHRMAGVVDGVLLSTDADTLPAPDWISSNLRAIAAGADAVGGVIELKSGELAALPRGVREAYLRDRRYQALVAAMEDALDPQPGDPWPRHLEHFGASLACTREIYARAGGIPAIPRLEDVAFVDRLRRVDARLRHEPSVVVYTSSRLEGRVETGLSEMLRTWETACCAGEMHEVATAEWLCHRFRVLRWLRERYAGRPVQAGHLSSPAWARRIQEAAANASGVGEFLMMVDCDRMIAESFAGPRLAPIAEVNATLAAMLPMEKRTVRKAPAMISGAAAGAMAGA